MSQPSGGVTSEAEQVQQLIAKQQIYEVVVRYCRGIDRRDRELILSTYHTDGSDDHGVYKGEVLGFVNRSVEFAWREYDVLCHFIGNHLVEIHADDVALSEAYVVAHHVKHGSDGRARLDLVHGRYIDKFTRRGGEWKIEHRTFACEWTETLQIDTTWLADTHFVRGKPAPFDLVYGEGADAPVRDERAARAE